MMIFALKAHRTAQAFYTPHLKRLRPYLAVRLTQARLEEALSKGELRLFRLTYPVRASSCAPAVILARHLSWEGDWRDMSTFLALTPERESWNNLHPGMVLVKKGRDFVVLSDRTLTQVPLLRLGR